MQCLGLNEIPPAVRRMRRLSTLGIPNAPACSDGHPGSCTASTPRCEGFPEWIPHVVEFGIRQAGDRKLCTEECEGNGNLLFAVDESHDLWLSGSEFNQILILLYLLVDAAPPVFSTDAFGCFARSITGGDVGLLPGVGLLKWRALSTCEMCPDTEDGEYLRSVSAAVVPLPSLTPSATPLPEACSNAGNFPVQRIVDEGLCAGGTDVCHGGCPLAIERFAIGDLDGDGYLVDSELELAIAILPQVFFEGMVDCLLAAALCIDDPRSVLSRAHFILMANVYFNGEPSTCEACV